MEDEKDAGSIEIDPEKKTPDGQKKNDNNKKPKGRKSSRRIFWCGIFLCFLIFTGISFFLSQKLETSQLFGHEWNWGIALFFLVILYMVDGILILGPQEKGGRVCLGWFVDEDDIDPGPIFCPRGICKLEKGPRLNIQSELPGNPEDIFREDGPVPEGKFPPIRIPFGPASTDTDVTEDDPLNRRMTQEVVLIVTWKILNFKQFYTTMGSVEEVKRQMEDASVAMLMEEFAKITPAVALKNLVKYNKRLKETISQRIGEEGSETWWGIKLLKAEIKIINFSHKMNEAIQEIAEISAKKKVTIITAQAQKESDILKGEGEGEGEKARLKGRTDGFVYMAENLKVSGTAVLGAETARGITENPGQKTIIAGAGGFENLVTTGATIAEILKDKNPEEKPADKGGTK